MTDAGPMGPGGGQGGQNPLGGIASIIAGLVGPNRQAPNQYGSAPSGYQPSQPRYDPASWFTDDPALAASRKWPGHDPSHLMPQPQDGQSILQGLGSFMHQFGGMMGQRNMATIIKAYVAYKQGQLRGQQQQTADAFNRMKMEAFEFDQREREMGAAVSAAIQANQLPNGQPTPALRTELSRIAGLYHEPALVTAFDNRSINGVNDYIRELDKRNLDMQKLVLQESKQTDWPSVDAGSNNAQNQQPTVPATRENAGSPAAQPPAASPAPGVGGDQGATTPPATSGSSTGDTTGTQQKTAQAQPAKAGPTVGNAPGTMAQPSVVKNIGADQQYTTPNASQQNTDKSVYAGTQNFTPGGSTEQHARAVINGAEGSTLNELKPPAGKFNFDYHNAVAIEGNINKALDDAIGSGLHGQALINKLYTIDKGFAGWASRIASWKEGLPGGSWGNRLSAQNQRLQTAAMAINPRWNENTYKAVYPYLFDAKSKTNTVMTNAPSVVTAMALGIDQMRQIVKQFPDQTIDQNFINSNYYTNFTPNSVYAKLQQALRTIAQEAANVFNPGASVQIYEDIKSGFHANAPMSTVLGAVGIEAGSLDRRMTAPNDTISRITGVPGMSSEFYHPESHDAFQAILNTDGQSFSTTNYVPPELASVIHQIPVGSTTYSKMYGKQKVWFWQLPDGRRGLVDPSQMPLIKVPNAAPAPAQ